MLGGEGPFGQKSLPSLLRSPLVQQVNRDMHSDVIHEYILPYVAPMTHRAIVPLHDYEA